MERESGPLPPSSGFQILSSGEQVEEGDEGEGRERVTMSD
jgi:hypothetical protein